MKPTLWCANATGVPILTIALLAALPAPGRVSGAEAQDPTRGNLDLPLYEPAAGATAVPAYDARRLEIRLRGDAAAGLQGALLSRGRTGVAPVDAVLERLGVGRVEMEFPRARRLPADSRAGELRNFLIVHLPAGVKLADALTAFRAEASVASASPIGIYPVQLTPNDSLFSQQYWIRQPSGLDSKLAEVWDVTTGDTSVVLAVIDTGVLWDHPDLGGPPPFTAGNIWHNWLEMAGTPGVDDDGNGFVDDYRGWDFVDGVSGPAGEDTDTPDNDPSDFVGHGTFVAGTAAAIPDNVSGTAGSGYNLKVMALRAGWDDGVSSGGVVDMAFCAQAIQYATDNGAKVINCSWLNGDLEGLGVSVDYAIANGVTVVVAAGNLQNESQTLNYLSTRGDCVDVAALDPFDFKAWFSSYGTWVDVSAAGQGFLSTTSNEYQPAYRVNSGTSFAAPVVSAVIGLYQSWRLGEGLPLATPREVLLRVRDTADPVDDLNPGLAGKLGGGRANAMRMLFDPPTSLVAGFPGEIASTPAFVEWDSGEEALVFGTAAGQVFAVSSISGESLAGWPVATGGAVMGDPVIFDIDLDGRSEVLIGSDDGRIHALNADGTAVSGWPVTVGGGIRSGPAVADVAGGPEYEVILGTSSPHAVQVLDRHGQAMPGWPVPMPAAVLAGPAASDLEPGGDHEIVIAGMDSSVYVFRGDGTTVPGWPVKVGAAVESSPSIGDVNGDGDADVVVGCSDAKVYAWSAAGVALPGWPVDAGAPVRSSPALVALDGDDFLEVVCGTDDSLVQVWHHDGSAVAGWPYAATAEVRGAPAVADVDGDGGLEIVVGSVDGQVHVIDADGSGLPHWPRALLGASGRGISLGDPDGDGRLEGVGGSSAGELYVWDFGRDSFDPTLTPWFTAGRSFLRQRAVDLPAIDVAEGIPTLSHMRLSLSPNPSAGSTLLSLTGIGGRAGEVEVRIFAPTGRLILRRSLSFDDSGRAVWTLAPEGADRERLPTGIYFVEAQTGDRVARAKWVVLR